MILKNDDELEGKLLDIQFKKIKKREKFLSQPIIDRIGNFEIMSKKN